MIAVSREEWFIDRESEHKPILHPGSVFVSQAVEVFFHGQDLHSVIHRTLQEVFSFVDSYFEYIPSYGSFWGFCVASGFGEASRLDPKEINRKLEQEQVGSLRYYDGETHQRLFSLPRIMRENIEQQTTISTRKNPLSVFPG